MTDTAARLDHACDALNRIVRISVDPDVTRIAERALDGITNGGTEAGSPYVNLERRSKLECAAAIATRARDSLPLSPDARAAFDRIVTILDEVRHDR